jgi:hypothetical protein
MLGDARGDVGISGMKINIQVVEKNISHGIFSLLIVLKSKVVTLN